MSYILLPSRNTTRLRGYDYRQAGAYFCTICVHRHLRRRTVWGCIEDGAMRLNRFGRLVERCWYELPEHHAGVELDEMVIMPNHVHGIVFLTGMNFEAPHEAQFGPQMSSSLSSVIGGFKSAITRSVHHLRGSPTCVWQERFYEHIIRNENELNAIRRYIHDNPANWPEDRCHPGHPEFDLPWRGVAPNP